MAITPSSAKGVTKEKRGGRRFGFQERARRSRRRRSSAGRNARRGKKGEGETVSQCIDAEIRRSISFFIEPLARGEGRIRCRRVVSYSCEKAFEFDNTPLRRSRRKNLAPFDDKIEKKKRCGSPRAAIHLPPSEKLAINAVARGPFRRVMRKEKKNSIVLGIGHAARSLRSLEGYQSDSVRKKRSSWFSAYSGGATPRSYKKKGEKPWPSNHGAVGGGQSSSRVSVYHIRFGFVARGGGWQGRKKK